MTDRRLAFVKRCLLFVNGVSKHIAFVSTSMSTAERNYTRIEKEGLAIVFGIKKSHKCPCGPTLKALTIHQPLTAILHPKRATKGRFGLPLLQACRRYAGKSDMILSSEVLPVYLGTTCIIVVTTTPRKVFSGVESCAMEKQQVRR